MERELQRSWFTPGERQQSRNFGFFVRQKRPAQVRKAVDFNRVLTLRLIDCM
jgi:hypothetical protein